MCNLNAKDEESQNPSIIGGKEKLHKKSNHDPQQKEQLLKNMQSYQKINSLSTIIHYDDTISATTTASVNSYTTDADDNDSNSATDLPCVSLCLLPGEDDAGSSCRLPPSYLLLSCTSRKYPNKNIFNNFCWMSILFSANHGCAMSCLSLATAQLGSLGAWQSVVLYLTYTISAIVGATYIVKVLGARDALIVGMGTFCAYVGCFWVATLYINTPWQVVAALTGAILGGFGGGLIWTAQGVYFSLSAEEHALAIAAASNETNSPENYHSILTTRHLKQQEHHHDEERQQLLPERHRQRQPNNYQQQKQPLSVDVSDSNSLFAAVFAFIYLTEEVAFRTLSSFLLDVAHWSWTEIYALYTVVSILSTILMLFVRNYTTDNDSNNKPSQNKEKNSSARQSKVLAAWNLLRNDPKMKYMIGFNMVFGFASAFVNSYINGQVIQIALDDDKSKYVGILSACVPIVATIMSLVFGRLSQWIGKGPILIIGATCFAMVVVPFIFLPNAEHWNRSLLLVVYMFHGTGRATFEGTLRATFADLFPSEKEGAFANIILQNGLSGTIGYILTSSLSCSRYTPTKYCIQYRDGTFHDVLSFELLVIISAILAILGYWRTTVLQQQQQCSIR